MTHWNSKTKEELKQEAFEAHSQQLKEEIRLNSRNMADAEADERMQRIVDTPKGSSTVKKLDLMENILTRVPPHVQAFHNCKYIFAGKNKITTLTTSPHLFAMTWLRELSLPENQLTTVPQEIDRLQQLIVLDLEHNKLTSLPASMSRLVRLEQIMLFGNDALTDAIAQSVRGADAKPHTQKILQRIAEKFASTQAESVAASIPIADQGEKCTVM